MSQTSESNNVMSTINETTYKTTRDFVQSSSKHIRSSVRRVISYERNSQKELYTNAEFSFSDSEKENARKLHVKIELDTNVLLENTDKKEYYAKRCKKISIKRSEDSRFTTVATYLELYKAIKEYYKLS